MGAKIIVFDLNGTLLDMSVLDPHFDRIFGSNDYRERWFAQLQVLWMTTIACDSFEPFDKLAKAALQMLAAKESIDLSTADQSAVLEQMTQLPPFPDVSASLIELRDAGYRLVALTNGTQKSAKAQLKYAGLTEAFEALFTADQVKRYKPAAEPYLYAAKELDQKPKKLLLVAAHAWDIQGAHQAGLQTAFIRRPRQVLNPLASKPDYVAENLSDLVRKLV